MMLAIPWIFGLAVLGAVGVAALHLLSVREPPVRPLPTARFVPAGSARAVARQPRLSDRRLLALRVLALLAFGMAFSGLRCGAARGATVDLVYVAPAVMADSLTWRTALLRDTAGRGTATVHTEVVPGLADDPGVAIVRALRDGSRFATEQSALERVGMTVVVPPTVRTLRGWTAWRSQWPAQIRVVVANEAVPAAKNDSGRVDVVGGPADDVVRAAYDNTVRRASAVPVRIVRDDTVSDAIRRTMASDAAMAVVVWWPRSGAPAGWSPATDTVGALAAGGRALVGPFVRRARWTGGVASARDAEHSTTWRPVVWWSDGEIAAIERTINGRCERQVAVAVPSASDLFLSASARSVLDAIIAPCGGTLSAHQLRDPAAQAPTHVPASMLRQRTPRDASSDPWWLMPLLLGIGALALGAEWWWRARHGAA